MKKDNFKTNVLFKILENQEYQNGEVIAVFVDQKESGFKNYVSYMHIGQHSAANIEFINSCRIAEEGEYNDLLQELENIGYNVFDLNLQLNNWFKNTDENINFIENYLRWCGYDIFEVTFYTNDYNKHFLNIETDEFEFSFNLSDYINVTNSEIIADFIDYYNDNY